MSEIEMARTERWLACFLTGDEFAATRSALRGGGYAAVADACGAVADAGTVDSFEGLTQGGRDASVGTSTLVSAGVDVSAAAKIVAHAPQSTRISDVSWFAVGMREDTVCPPCLASLTSMGAETWMLRS